MAGDRPPGAHAAQRSKPDPRPMRLALGTGALATLSAVAASIVAPAAGPQLSVQPPPQPVAPAASSVSVTRPVVYVQLRPGETAPPGARVIDAAAPKPVTIVTVVPAPSQRPVIVRTTQSGKVLP